VADSVLLIALLLFFCRPPLKTVGRQLQVSTDINTVLEMASGL